MACWKIATSPMRAALKRRVARSRASRGRDKGSASAELVELVPFATFALLMTALGAWEDGAGSRGRGIFSYTAESFVVRLVDFAKE